MNNHHKQVIRWQMANPEKYKAEQLARCHPQLTRILYECLHYDRPKINHHPDYKKWNLIFKVCHECHCKFHPSRRKPIKTIERRARNKIISKQKRIAKIWGSEETAKRIKEIRLFLGLTQDQFICLLGLKSNCHAMVSRWELGKTYPGHKFLERIERIPK